MVTYFLWAYWDLIRNFGNFPGLDIMYPYVTILPLQTLALM